MMKRERGRVGEKEMGEKRGETLRVKSVKTDHKKEKETEIERFAQNANTKGK